MNYKFGKRVEGVQYADRPSTYGVIVKNGQIAVIKSDFFNKYFLIGGGIEKGETETETLRREAIEEVGFQIEIGEKIGEAVEYFYAEIDKLYIAKKCNFYRASLMSKIEKKTENKLICIDKDGLEKMYHKSHQWIVEKEFNNSILPIESWQICVGLLD